MHTIQALCPGQWPEYELIDSGNFEKLERYGSWVVARPEPQAVWDKSLPEAEWEKLAHATFKREPGNNDLNSERGRWVTRKNTPERWMTGYRYKNTKLMFKVALSSFKHVGVFPEQAANWDYIIQKTSALATQQQQPRVLNLFAYTGIASLAARSAGAEVTHVDAVKQVITWARENMEASGQSDIRWMVEDALKFAEREVRRGNTYHGIIMDPPAYGRGPKGEKWLLEEHISTLMKLSKALLTRKDHFFILNLYSMGFSSIIAENLVRASFPQTNALESGELYLPDRAGKKLPLGIFCRFSDV